MQPAAGRVYLHIGVAKTGTTYLQSVLHANRGRLAAAGVAIPGRRMTAHFYAAQDLRGVDFGKRAHPAVPGAWDRLAGEVRRWGGPTVIVSHEMFAAASAEQVARAAAALVPRELHVVLTARDLARQIPAMWQELVKIGRSVPFDRYLQRLARPGDQAAGEGFWRAQDITAVLERWSSVVPASQVHVVTVPAADADVPSDELWRRFGRACGLEPSAYDTDVPRRNVSMGFAETELVRRLNERLDGQGHALHWRQRERLLKRRLAEDVLAGRGKSARVEVPAAMRAWVDEQSETTVAELQRAGYDVIGSLDDLLPRWPSATPEEGAPPSADDVVDAAVDAIAALLEDAAERPGQGVRASAAHLWDAVGTRLRLR